LLLLSDILFLSYLRDWHTSLEGVNEETFLWLLFLLLRGMAAGEWLWFWTKNDWCYVGVNLILFICVKLITTNYYLISSYIINCLRNDLI
jgi:hypothetical protein